MVSRAADRMGMVAMSESTPDGRAADPLVTLAEAAAAMGRPKEALRAMIRRGKLEAIRGNDGRFLVRLPSDIPLQPRGQPARPSVRLMILRPRLAARPSWRTLPRSGARPRRKPVWPQR